ncbi:T9SS type A sorting domain-containing protein [Pontibacter actiniarum]|uniref:T9SS C-terminal target domain-containing protein n=1 Tax=Pontibacter actiniarum TaxID=323450 RepID=A0A1X9YSA4_9BACT|nr:T9SS type A sorting domain-containing protein [Pontibacter actiniarum]ARS35776.1 T9SS C-terminal target domain-containing protein [Pontibacter actiniarum]
MRHRENITYIFRQGVLLLALTLLPLLAAAQAKAPYRLAGGNYTQTFDAISGWTTDFAAGEGANPFQVATPSPTLPSQNKVFVSGSTGGVQMGRDTTPLGPESIVLLATGADGANAAAFDLLLDFTGTEAGTLSLDWAEVNNSSGNRQATFSVQANTGTDGAFEELPGTTVVLTNNEASSGALANIALPAAFSGKTDARLRFYLVTSASEGVSGSRPKINLDNLAITATASEGEPGPGDPGTGGQALVLSTAALPDFGNVEVGSVSAVRSFNVQGEGLSGNVTITPAPGFEIRVGDNPFACCAITLSPVAGSLAATTVEVRFAPSAAEAYVAGIAVSDAGGPAMQVAVSGTGIAPAYPATLASTAVTDVATNSATAGGEISSDGGSDVMARGVVWSTAANPTLADAKTADGTGTGAFTSQLTGLAHSTTYYVRAYATNAVGTTYGQERSFTTVAIALAAEPTIASTIAISEVTGNSMKLTLAGGDGVRHLVLARQGGAVDAVPEDGLRYTADAAFRQGQELGTGNFVVYSGTGNEVTVTGLRGSNTYHFAVFDYNDNDTEFAENYLTETAGRASESTPAAAAFLALEENFDYTAASLLTDNGWAAHSGGTTNAIPVVAEGLAYEGYPSGGIGNSAQLVASGQDVNRGFEPVSAGTAVYTAFLVKVSAASAGGDYFLHLAPASMGTTFRSRVYVRAAGEGKVQFGISGSGSEQVYTTESYDLNTTYLLVTKYTFDETDNTTTLYVNPAAAEPATGAATITEGGDRSPSDIGTIALRQGSSSPALTLDGIRVATSYNLARGAAACTEPAIPAVVTEGMALQVTSPVAGATYQWYLNGTAIEEATAAAYTATAAGSYTVTAKVGECVSEASAAVMFTPTGVRDEQLATGVAVYPVPATDRLRVQAQETGQGTAQVLLLDLAGRQVLSQRLHTAGTLDVTLAVGQLPRGVYVLLVQTPKGFISRRVALH